MPSSARKKKLRLRDACRHGAAGPLARLDQATEVHDDAISAHGQKISVQTTKSVRRRPTQVEERRPALTRRCRAVRSEELSNIGSARRRLDIAFIRVRAFRPPRAVREDLPTLGLYEPEGVGCVHDWCAHESRRLAD